MSGTFFIMYHNCLVMFSARLSHFSRSMVTKLVKTDAVSSSASLIQYQEGVVSELHFKQVPKYVGVDTLGLRPHLEKPPRLPETDFLRTDGKRL